MTLPQEDHYPCSSDSKRGDCAATNILHCYSQNDRIAEKSTNATTAIIIPTTADSNHDESTIHIKPTIGQQQNVDDLHDYSTNENSSKNSSPLSFPPDLTTQFAVTSSDKQQSSLSDNKCSTTITIPQKFYVLLQGKSTQRCIYLDEHDLQPQIDGYQDAKYTICDSWEMACQYISAPSSSLDHHHHELEFTPQISSQQEIEGTITCQTIDESALWEVRYEELVQYYKSHGTSDVPAQSILGHFAARQKIEYVAFLHGKPTCLTQDRIDRLRAIDFSFGGHRDRKTFQRYVDELYRYREKHGGEDPPLGSKLSKWMLGMQKKYLEYKKGNKSMNGIDRVKCDALERLGFEWTRCVSSNVSSGVNAPTAMQPLSHSLNLVEDTPVEALELSQVLNNGDDRKDWNSQSSKDGVIGALENPQSDAVIIVNKLIESQFSTSPSPDTIHPSLAMNNLASLSWSHRMDQSGEISCLETSPRTSKKRKADCISDDTWDDFYEELKAFKEKNGHCIPPVQPATKLRQWVDKIRNEYKKLRAGSPSILTAQRLQKLNDIDFQFERKIKPRTWEERYEELARFKEKFGHCRVPRLFSQPSYEGLGKWVADQRMKYNYMLQGRRTNMTPERAQRLTELGMVWAVFKLLPKEDRAERKPWDHRYVELVEFKRQHGHTLVPQAFPILGQWVHTQRVNYKLMKQGRKSAMTPEQALKLEEIGFAFE
jgi:hypothetical protein